MQDHSSNRESGFSERDHRPPFYRSERSVRLLLALAGVASTIWFLARVIPKPSRLNYPCMKIAAPVAGSFLLSLAGIVAGACSFAKALRDFRSSRYLPASVALLLGIGAWILMVPGSSDGPRAASASLHGLTGPGDSANRPVGKARGIFPGRVVWVHDPDATNENCVVDQPGHGWVESENMNQTAVGRMLSAALGSLTGQTSDSAAWGAIFRYHNAVRGKGAVGYAKGEKIFIKTNATSAMHVNPADLTSTSYYGVSETSVAAVRAILRQLVYTVGVAQRDIYVGDPIKHIYKHLYDVWHAEFPDVHYLDHNDFSYLGRERAAVSKTAKVTYSDKGKILRTGAGAPVYSDSLYAIFDDAEYLLNVPMLKGHQRAGVTMFAKNHFGSQTRAFADHLHNGLVSPGGVGDQRRTGYGLYRVQVDLMSHRLLGGKNLVYIMDALWAADWELDKPAKWRMPPFNNDYTSSIFVSLDPVAIESVGYDFLRAEFTSTRGADSSVQMRGVDDYLHQAADSALWPRDIKYDSNNDGVYFASLGVHEHWNNTVEKKYTRNLGTGSGIELIAIEQSTPDNVTERQRQQVRFQLLQNYPNPFNPNTTIRYALPHRAHVTLAVYNTLGQLVATLVNSGMDTGFHEVRFHAGNLASGVYFYRLQTESYMATKKLLVTR